MIERAFDGLARLLFVLVALALFALAISLVVSGGWQLIQGALSAEIGIYNLMNGVGLLIVSLAIADVAKFVVEENVVRERELRSPAEALRSLTKFMTIIIIALSLEGGGRHLRGGAREEVRPAGLPDDRDAGGDPRLIGLGAFQFLSRRSQREAAAGADDADRPTGRRGSTAPGPSPARFRRTAGPPSRDRAGGPARSRSRCRRCRGAGA